MISAIMAYIHAEECMLTAASVCGSVGDYYSIK